MGDEAPTRLASTDQSVPAVGPEPLATGAVSPSASLRSAPAVEPRPHTRATPRAGGCRATRYRLWRFAGWALAFELLLLWVVLFAPGALLWLLTAAAATAAVILLTSVWITRSRRGAAP